MTVLVDHEIHDRVKRGVLGISPFDPCRLQPASYDLALSNEFRVFFGKPILDVEDDAGEHMDFITVSDGDGFYLRPQEFALASTIERFRFPEYYLGRLEGKSSLARRGLIVHTTAGFFDPGFEGYATLELFNASSCTLVLRPGMKIAQMSFMLLGARPRSAYGTVAAGSKYQGQTGPTPSRYHLNFDPERETVVRKDS